MKPTEFEFKIIESLSLNEKDSRKMDRTLDDISQETGLSKNEILEFTMHNADEELKNLQFSYDWENFRKKITNRIRPVRNSK